MKKIYIVIVLFLQLLLIGCSFHRTYYWNFRYEYVDISEIKIISVIVATFHCTYYTTLKEIDLEKAKDIYEDVSGLQLERCSLPHNPSGICLLFVFKTGEYDIISYDCLTYHRLSEDGEKIIHTHSLYCVAEEDKYYDIIDKYLN